MTHLDFANARNPEIARDRARRTYVPAYSRATTRQEKLSALCI
jgi:hypothetical protein